MNKLGMLLATAGAMFSAKSLLEAHAGAFGGIEKITKESRPGITAAESAAKAQAAQAK